MDQLIKSVQQLKQLAGFEGTNAEFRKSVQLIRTCRKTGFIADVKDPSEIDEGSFDEYFNHLVALTKKHLFANPEQRAWQKFISDPANRKAQRILHEFGVRGELFSNDSEDERPTPPQSPRRLTMEEFYEICRIQFRYDGSFLAFKKHIQKLYGSFAEYCIMKNYDINSTKWESDETAVRCAYKLGSVAAIKERSASLYKYLQSRGLFETLKLPEK